MLKHREPKTIHFEGIPGSGKTHTSERFCELLRGNGVDANWWLEELADHPIMPTEIRKRATKQNFPEACVSAWRSFLESQPNSVHVLDGYAFQTTVRFLFEQRLKRSSINAYFHNLIAG